MRQLYLNAGVSQGKGKERSEEGLPNLPLPLSPPLPPFKSQISNLLTPLGKA